MPFKSLAQNRWAHTPTGVRALGGSGHVKEWEAATDYHALPERKDPPMAKKWLQGAIKHPGKLTAEAHASGRSKLQQAEHDAKSDNPHIRGRGLLGIRLVKKSV